MPIKSIDPYLCEGCGACERACPSDVIRMKNGKASIEYPEDCLVCVQCALSCPRDAIDIEIFTEIGYYDQPWKKHLKR